MKKLGLLLIASVFLCSITVLAACSAALSIPLNLKVNTGSYILTWDRVESASGYKIDINNGERTASSTTNAYSYENLPAGKYTFKVKAVGKDLRDSEWSASTESTEKLPDTPFRLTLINNNTEYELSGMGKASGDVIIDDEYNGKPITSIAQSAFYSSSSRGLVTSITLGANIRKIGSGAFLDCKNLVSVTLNSKLVTIEKNAFAYCKKLESIDIPDSVTTIGDSAFISCTALRTVEIGTGLTSISNNTFSKCERLESIEIPGNVTAIGEYAFYQCTAMTNAVIHEGLTSMGDRAFWECKKLESIVIPDSTLTIGAHAFYDCAALRSVVVGNNLTKIGSYAFRNSGLWLDAAETGDLVYAGNYVVDFSDETKTDKAIKPGVLGIADSAFRQWPALKTITLPNTIRFIGDYAFYIRMDVTPVPEPQLASIAIPNSCVKIGNYAFQNCKSLANVTIGTGLMEMGSFVFAGTKYDGTGLVIVDNWVTQSKDKTITKVSLPAGIVGISNSAFEKITNLRIVSFADDGARLRAIGDYAFYEDVTMTHFNISEQAATDNNPLIKIPSSVKYIGKYAFHGCKGMIKLDLGTGVESIGAGAFRNNLKLEEVIIPDNVKTVGNDAFYGCIAVKSVTIGSGIKNMGDRVFNDCIGIKEATYKAGATITGMYTFGGCESLEKVVLPDSITTIQKAAFYKCDVLVDLAIPASVTKIESFAFYNCFLLNVTIPENLTEIDEYSFYNCSNLTSIEIPAGVTTIGDYAFYRCSSAASLTIPYGVTTIGNSAFLGCGGLTNIWIPETVTSIGSQSFRGCVGLTNVLIRNSLAVIGSHAFYGCNFMTIYCEASARPAEWKTDWNSSYRPVLWGCVLSKDRTYVESFKKITGTLSNPNAINNIRMPYRNGYAFRGWTFTKGGNETDYSAPNINTAPNNVTLYAIWVKTSTTIDKSFEQVKNMFETEGYTVSLQNQNASGSVALTAVKTSTSDTLTAIFFTSELLATAAKEASEASQTCKQDGKVIYYGTAAAIAIYEAI